MIVNGIIAEYNPFHNGHQYHIAQSKAATNADYTIVVMSGNFLQRGLPAIADKHTRTKMALAGGADLVLELPSLYATASAEFFAAGGVSILDALQVVTHLSFGSEEGQTEPLMNVAALLSREDAPYQSALKSYLKQGFSFPEARTTALTECFPELAQQSTLLNSPNNILGIEYCKALLRRNSNITPCTIKRLGAGYHDTDTTGETASAQAIREALLTDRGDQVSKRHMPEEALQILRTYRKDYPAECSETLSGMLYYKLLSELATGFANYLDVSDDLSDRIIKRLHTYRDFSSFCDSLKTKELTYTRISRSLIHILLNIKKQDMALYREQAPYARILGFQKQAAPLLKVLNEKASIPLITSLADAEKTLPESALYLLKKDIAASQLYLGLTALSNHKTAENEYSIPLVIS
jgi:predicted nucleotidyltransferase